MTMFHSRYFPGLPAEAAMHVFFGTLRRAAVEEVPLLRSGAPWPVRSPAGRGIPQSAD
jgi:hypothetical protein